MLNEAEEEVWRTEANLAQGGEGVQYAVVDIPTGSLPLGRFWLEAVADTLQAAERVPLVVTISDQWMVANFEEVFDFLRYIASSQELDSLRRATGDSQRAGSALGHGTDPRRRSRVPEQFFERIRLASMP